LACRVQYLVPLQYRPPYRQLSLPVRNLFATGAVIPLLTDFFSKAPVLVLILSFKTIHI
jgi:hypothetical protein